MIDGWRIDIDGVVLLLSTLETTASELVTALDGIDAAYTTLNTGASPALSEVTNAVAAVIMFEQERLTSIGNRIAAGSFGLSTATQGYNQGLEEMAVNAQIHASASADNGDFSYFGVEPTNS